MIFPEALTDAGRIRAVPRGDRRAAAGQHDRVRQVASCLRAKQLADIGYNIVIYPVTTLRLAMGAVEAGLRRNRVERNANPACSTRCSTAAGSTAAALRRLQRIRHRYLQFHRRQGAPTMTAAADR